VEGIGTLIASSFRAGNNAMLAASTVALCTALVLINRFVWRRLYRVAHARFALNR
jgi:NitT/TauT family transport system permease protein